ncbi:MAG: hypothetical protein SF051_03440 [Elusimicrobiota bacterium]|nr:hypothetical protein [Elusimicrobiota bacterium]
MTGAPLVLAAALAAAAAPAAPYGAKGGWALITGRTTPELLALLDTGPLATEGGATVDPLRLVVRAMADATTGCGGALSLGEGRSSFILTLLAERAHHRANPHPLARPPAPCPEETVHAVDRAYPRHDGKGTIDDPRRPSTASEPEDGAYDERVVGWVRRHPRSYHAQSFETLDLRSEGGGRMRFPLILSTFALSHVLFWGRDDGGPTLERVLEHLEPGGALVMAPVRCRPEGGLPDSVGRYYERLRAMRERKVVGDFTALAPDSCRPGEVFARPAVLVVTGARPTPGPAR